MPNELIDNQARQILVEREDNISIPAFGFRDMTLQIDSNNPFLLENIWFNHDQWYTNPNLGVGIFDLGVDSFAIQTGLPCVFNQPYNYTATCSSQIWTWGHGIPAGTQIFFNIKITNGGVITSINFISWMQVMLTKSQKISATLTP